MPKPQLEKQLVAEQIDVWLRRAGLRQHTLAQRLNLSADEFYQGYKSLTRAVNTDATPAIKIVDTFAKQPAAGRATAGEALMFLIRTHLPLDRFAEVQGFFPPDEWRAALEALSSDKQWVRWLAQPPPQPARGQAEDVGEGVRPDAPYLLISRSSDPDTTWERIYLTEPVTVLGRMLPHEVGPSFVQLNQPHVSHEHAQIVSDQGSYMLKNWRAKYGVGLYEKALMPGETHALRHGDVFRIPDHDDHYRLMFLLSDKHTLVLPFHIEHSSSTVRVFDRTLVLAPAEYDLVVYLYRHRERVCSHEELSRHMWPDELEQLDTLGVLLSNVRRQIFEASNGFTFMQTIGKIGVRLVV